MPQNTDAFLFNVVSFYSFAETIEWRYGTIPMLVIYFAGMEWML